MKNNNNFAFVHIKEKDNSPVIFDMTKVGFTANPVAILTTIKEIKGSLDTFKKLPNHKEVFKNVLFNIGKSYNNLDYIFEHRNSTTKKNWEDFNNDCVLYCCYRYLYNNKELPIMTEKEREEKGIDLFAIKV